MSETMSDQSQTYREKRSMTRTVMGGETPKWFVSRHGFQRLVEQQILEFEPWMLLRGEDFAEKLKGLAKRYPGRELVPFARRTDNDDVACWERDGAERVVVIHDYASPGWESRRTYPDFWSWFRAAIEDMIEFDP